MTKKVKFEGKIKCPKCKELIEEGLTFCPECGSRIEISQRYNPSLTDTLF